MKRIVLKVSKVILIIVLLLNWINLIYCYLSIPNIDKITILESQLPVSKTDKILLLKNGDVLIHNKLFGLVQCFNSNGNFILGVQLQKNRNLDSTLVSYFDDKIYLFEAKTHNVYEFYDYELTNVIKSDEIVTDKDFYNKYPLSETLNFCTLTGKKIVITEKYSIDLNTTIWYVSPFYSFFIIILSGVFLSLSKNIEVNED